MENVNPSVPTRRRGAPKGNRNAFKHGYYSRALLAKEDKRDLSLARSVTGLDEEIAVLRFKLKSVLQKDPDNIRLIADALIALNRLMRTRSKFPVDMRESKVRAFENVYREIFSMGIEPELIKRASGF